MPNCLFTFVIKKQLDYNVWVDTLKSVTINRSLIISMTLNEIILLV